MLVPLELHCLTLQKGYLSPELAIGWQIGKYVEEFFDGLEEVGIAAARDDDAVLALSYLTRQHGHPGQVIVPEAARPWDFLFYHLTTGTRLGFTLIRQGSKFTFFKISNLHDLGNIDTKTLVIKKKFQNLNFICTCFQQNFVGHFFSGVQVKKQKRQQKNKESLY